MTAVHGWVAKHGGEDDEVLRKWLSVGAAGDPAATLCGLAAAVPRAWRPRSDADVHPFVLAAPAVALARCACASEDVAAFLDAGGRWAGYRDRAMAGFVDSLGLPTADGLLRHMATAFAKDVLVPAVVVARGSADVTPERLAGVAWTILFAGRTLGSALRSSADWHGRVQNVAALVRAAQGARMHGLSWSPVLPSHAEGDLSLVPLSDGAALAHEGGRGPDPSGVDGLDHCVALYAARCATGCHRIASVRRTAPDGSVTRISTVEFEVTPHGLVVEQHLGLRNAAPCAEASAFVDRYVGFAGSDLPIDLRGIGRSKGSVTPAGSRAHRLLVFETAMRAWRPLLPRSLRDADAEAVFALVLDVCAARAAAGSPVGDVDPRWFPGPFAPRVVARPRSILPRRWSPFADARERAWRGVAREAKVAEAARKRAEAVRMSTVIGHFLVRSMR